MWKPSIVAVALVTLVSGVTVAGCEKGPVQKAGEKVDEALDQDKLIGKGPAEKVGDKVDEAVDDVKR
jgi:hypothetical protein